MKTFIILCLGIFSISASYTQSPIDAIFKKYIETNGVDISIDKVPMQIDTSIKAPLNAMLKTLEFSKEDEDKKSDKLFSNIIKQCNKILSQKEYTLVSVDKQNDNVHKIYKKGDGPMAEICELEYDDERVTLTVTQISGMANDLIKNSDIKINQ